MIKYQDRILYGTDLISREDENESEAMNHAHSRWLNDWLYLATDQVMTTDEFEGEFRGLRLPREVIDKIYYHNAIRWFKYPVEPEGKSEKRTSYSNPVGDYIHMGDTVLCIQADQPWENPQSMHSRCNEGSFVIKHNDTYYMTYSANHYADPFYGIGYATSDSPLGPWIKSMKNPIVSMDSITGVYGPGHNSITTSPDGTELFMVYHAHESLKDKRRTVNIDRLQFDEDGNLRIIGPTRTQQPLPAGSY